jgi:hypothetical protein
LFGFGSDRNGSERVVGDLEADRHPLEFGEGVDVHRGAPDTLAVAGVLHSAERHVGLVGDGLLVDVDLADVDEIGKTHGLPDVAEDAEREAVVVVTDDPRGLTECQPVATGHDALDFLVSESRVVPSNLSDYSPG